MLNMVRTAIGIELASFAGERLWDAGKAGFRAFQKARQDRAVTYPPVNLNAASEPDIAELLPFRVRVSLPNQEGCIASHDIYASNADEAVSWAQRHYEFIRMDISISATAIN